MSICVECRFTFSFLRSLWEREGLLSHSAAQRNTDFHVSQYVLISSRYKDRGELINPMKSILLSTAFHLMEPSNQLLLFCLPQNPSQTSFFCRNVWMFGCNLVADFCHYDLQKIGTPSCVMRLSVCTVTVLYVSILHCKQRAILIFRHKLEYFYPTDFKIFQRNEYLCIELLSPQTSVYVVKI